MEYWEYSYNLRNQLTRVTKNGGLIATYAYDALGLRVSATTTITSKTTGQSKTTTRDYLFDLADRVIHDRVISTSASLPANEDPETSIENSHIFATAPTSPRWKAPSKGRLARPPKSTTTTSGGTGDRRTGGNDSFITGGIGSWRMAARSR